MKKAKIMLSAIAVIAVLSGTLAFKAHFKGSTRTYYVCPTVGVQTCTTAFTTANAAITSIQPGNLIQFTTYATLTDPQGAACTTGVNPSGPCVSPLYGSQFGF